MTFKDSDRLLELLALQADDRLTDEQWEELNVLIFDDAEARKVYLKHMFLHAMLHRIGRSVDDARELEGLCSAESDAPAGGKPTERSPILGWLGDAFRGGADFLSRPLAMTLLSAIALPALLLLVLLLGLMRQTEDGPAVAVAKLTGMHRCVWEEDGAEHAVGEILRTGRTLNLKEGLAELTFDNGAQVILEGPATFRVTAADGGFLRQGVLTATVPEPARGFTIRTSLANVVDLGTEFGLEVRDGV
ncbi:MAG: hypothetical protein JW818_23115, partial [Pirellulales bacterium]|nr:hypothetical protein [Pirellulales bacterium]